MTAPDRGMTGVVIRSGRETFLILSAPTARLDLSRLTAVQRAIVADLVAGRSNATIAQRRRRSPRTIANQVAAIFGRLGVSSRGELIARISVDVIRDQAAVRAGRVKK